MNRRVLMILGAALLFACPLLMAQAGMRDGRGRGVRNYNRATETTVKGTVEEVTETTGRRGLAGTHLMLKTDEGTYDVHVGPSSYVSAQQFTFAKGETIETVGSKTSVSDKDVLIARQITKSGKILTLRDEQGFPKWSRAASQINP